MATLHNTILKQAILQKSFKRPWWDVTAMWKGRYHTIHIDLPIKENSDPYFDDLK